jgi:D-arabinose 1-dehydrogenase-like Zn-dependent alcohol dehydrogenase
MCGGVTMFAPLKAYETGPGKTVGIVGVGGLGHYGVLLAKAMGAKVVGISRKESKRAEVLGLGADDYIATDDDKDWVQKHFRSLDLIVSTVASSKVCTVTYDHTSFKSYSCIAGPHQRLLFALEEERHIGSGWYSRGWSFPSGWPFSRVWPQEVHWLPDRIAKRPSGDAGACRQE